MRAYSLLDVDLLESLYAHRTVKMTTNDNRCAAITVDTAEAQCNALSPRIFLIFMKRQETEQQDMSGGFKYVGQAVKALAPTERKRLFEMWGVRGKKATPGVGNGA